MSKIKIAATEFYKDFARYFDYLEDHGRKFYAWKEFLHICIYPCAFRYHKKKGNKAILAPFELGQLQVSKNNFQKISDEELAWIAQYEIIYFNNSISISALKTKARAYFDYYCSLLAVEEIEGFISSGDSRIYIRSAILACQKLGIPVAYFEQGPYGTTIIDFKGVNANLSFAGKGPKIINQAKQVTLVNTSADPKPSPDKYYSKQKKKKSEIISTMITLVLMYMPIQSRAFLPIELKQGSIKSLFNSRIRKWLVDPMMKLFQQSSSHHLFINDYILLLLQMPNDAQTVLHSRCYGDIRTMVSDIVLACPEGLNVIVREHPYYRGQYDSWLYSFIDKLSHRVVLDLDSKYENLIKNASIVATLNSTGGIDALRLGKTVVTLGDAYYSDIDAVYSVKARYELPQILRSAVLEPRDPLLIKSYFIWLMNNLIAGHYTDEALLNASSVIQAINSCWANA